MSTRLEWASKAPVLTERWETFNLY